MNGCASSDPTDAPASTPKRPAGADWPEVAYVSAAPYKRLVIEIDRVAGLTFGRRERVMIERFCKRFCDKPEGIVLRVDPPIAREAVNGEDPALVLLRRTEGPGETNAESAYLHVLIYDSRLEGRPQPDPVRVLPSCPSAVLIDRAWLRERVRPTVSERALLGVALLHGLGRAFGLRPGSDGKPTWCEGKGCLMDPAIFAIEPAALFLGNVSYDEPRLCTACRKRLFGERALALSPKLAFHGPVLVRQEEGYFVASLPFYTWLGFGKAHSLRVRELLARAIKFMEARPRYHERGRAYVDAELPWPIAPSVRKRIEQALERASRDPDRTVARLARLLTRKLRARLTKSP